MLSTDTVVINVHYNKFIFFYTATLANILLVDKTSKCHKIINKVTDTLSNSKKIVFAKI